MIDPTPSPRPIGEPLAQLWWMGLDRDGSLRSGRCGAPAPRDVAHRAAAKLVELGFDAWVEVEGRAG
jgi:hypothetical protein